MREIWNRSVIESLSDKARSYGIDRLAPAIDKAPSSLYAELNPYGDQGKAKIGFDDALEIMRLIEDVTTLELAAARLGYRLCPLNAEPDKATVAEEIADVAEAFGKLAAVCMDSAASESTVHLMSVEVHRQVDEAEAAKFRVRKV